MELEVPSTTRPKQKIEVTAPYGFTFAYDCRVSPATATGILALDVSGQVACPGSVRLAPLGWMLWP